jgi:ankyrin repeat protein
MSDSGQLLEELTEFCRSDSLSEDGLREIIQRHRWAPNNPSVQNYEFFLFACDSGRVTEGILRYLLHNFPGAGTFIDRNRFTPLHQICYNKNVTRGMVQLLIDAFPDSVRNENNYGHMPLHPLCFNRNLEDEAGLEIVELLIERCPESVRQAGIDGSLPIHSAAGHQSPEFCRILIEAYPGSERITNNNGSLPFHQACRCNTVATAKYFYQLYPESINVANRNGGSIHYAIMSLDIRTNPANAINVVQFLLDCNPDVVLQKLQSKLPLYWVCYRAIYDNAPTKLNAHLKILQILYDAHPEAVERNEITSELDSFPEEIRTFINKQLTYAQQARDLRQMNTPDENGQLPLHRVLRDNVTLGSIKLLVKGNPSATRNLDDSLTLPLHIACQHHESADVARYLINRDSLALEAVDRQGNTVLHHACRGAKYGTIALLLEKYGAVSVSKRNTQNQLPIDLLFESEAVIDRGGTEYTESIYRLIRAHPETVMFSSNTTNECISHNRKKRRREAV